MRTIKIGRLAGMVGVSALTLGLSNVASAAVALSTLHAGDLVISEIMIYPSGTEALSEWFEIYNASGQEIDLSGLVITGKTGETQTVSSSVIVAAGDYALFGVNSVTAKNGNLPTLDYLYSRLLGRFDNGTDTLAISYSDITFDSISWSKTDATFKATLGSSLQLDPLRLSARMNADGDYWCLGATSYGAGGNGTPGSANESCGIETLAVSELVAGDLVVTEVMVQPYAANDPNGEWIEVYNPTGVDINLNGLVLEDDGTDSYTIAKDIIAFKDEVVLLAAYFKYSKNGGLPTVDGTYTRNLFRQDNGADEVVLSYGGTVIDEVLWTKALFPMTTGYSFSLDPTAWDATSNDTSTNWCNGVSAYGSTLNFGTPQADNDSCF